MYSTLPEYTEDSQIVQNVHRTREPIHNVHRNTETWFQNNGDFHPLTRQPNCSFWLRVGEELNVNAI